MSLAIASNCPIILSAGLQKLRENRKHCDVVFVGENDNEFYAHKCLLAVTTDIFEFEYDAYYHLKAESHLKNREVERINLDKFGVEGSVFKIILDIVYETRPKITLDEALDVIFAAQKLSTEAVVRYAEDVIIKNKTLEGEQLAKLCHLPELQNCERLLNHVKTHLHRHFPKVSLLPEFYRISVEVLCRLDVLKKSNLFLSASTCVDFIVKWISYDLHDRISCIGVIVHYLNPTADDAENEKCNAFLEAITDVCRNNNNRDQTIALLRFGLQGLLRESVDRNFPYKDEITVTSALASAPAPSKNVTYMNGITATSVSAPAASSNVISGQYSCKCGCSLNNVTVTRSRGNCLNKERYLDWFHCDRNVDA